LQALTGHLEREAAIGGYEAEDEAEPRVRETYELLGRLLGAAARNLAIVENATVAFSQAVSAFDFRAGDRIVTTRADYPSNQLTYLSLARRVGVETVRADDLPERGAFPLFLDMRGADWTDPDAFRLAEGARRFENWEFAYALVAGLSAAARYALVVGAAGRERACRLAALLRPQLADIAGVRVLD